MKALRLETGRPIPPFSDPVGDVMVGNRSLVDLQTEAIVDAGLGLVDAPPADEPYFLFSDRTYFTTEAVRLALAAGEGCARVQDPDWLGWTASLQDAPEPGRFEFGIHPAGPPNLAQWSPVDLDLGLREYPMPDWHPALAHAARFKVKVGTAMVHQMDHWSHIVRVNQLELAVGAERARMAWERSPWWKKTWWGLRLLGHTRSTDPNKVAAALVQRGRNVKIHPSAVVEVSVLGDDVEIGAHAVVRASVLGDGVHVEEFASVQLSVLGERSRVGRYGMLKLCTLYPGAMVSTGDGYQASVFGRDAFVAWGATALDLSFGKPVRVERDGPGTELVDSGRHFLGTAIGHRARIGHGVRIGYGVSIPNDAFIVADSADLLRDASGAQAGEPAVVRDGALKPIKSGGE